MRILNRIAAIIIVEIGPHPGWVAFADSLCPPGQFTWHIIVAIPTLGPMKSDIDLIARPDQFVRQPRRAARAKRRVHLLEREEGVLVPPTAMPELNHVSVARIELIEYPFESSRAVAKARRKLKEKASHVRRQQTIDKPKILYELCGSYKSLHVRNQLANLYGVDKRPALCLADP